MKAKKIICLFLAGCILSATACKNDSNSVDGGENNLGSTVITSDYEQGIINANDYFGDENGWFVKNGTSEYTIVVPSGAPKNVSYAASQLQYYVLRVTGVSMPIKTDDAMTYSTTQKVISIGDTIFKRNSNVVNTVDYSTLKTGGYVIKNYGNVYLLDSAAAEGIVYATYEFLRAFFKVEFLTEDYTYIEESENIKAYAVDYVSIPDFPIRDYYAYSIWHQGLNFGAKLGINSPSYKATESIYGTTEYYSYYGYYYEYQGERKFNTREGHTIESLLYTDAYRNGYRNTPNEYPTIEQYPDLNPNLSIGYVPEHPEWYAYTPGASRVGEGGRSQEEICYTNGLDDDGNYIVQSDNVPFEEMTLPTKMIQIIKTMILEETSQNATYLMLGQADFGETCTCTHCQRAMEKVKTFGGMTARWVNTIAKEINKWMEEEQIDREVKFVIFAYNRSINAPVTWNNDHTDCVINDDSLNLVDNIMIKMAYNGCCYHSVWDMSCEQNEKIRENFTAWSKISKGGFVIWDYTAVYKGYLYYLPNFGSIKNNYKYYQEIGVGHLLSQGVPGEYNFYEAQLHQWVSMKLMWETEQDVNALIEKYNDLYFGKYAKYVNLYRDIFDNYFAVKDNFHASISGAFDFLAPQTYNKDVLLKAANVIQEAIDLVKQDAELSIIDKELMESRLRGVKVTPQYMLLDMNLILDNTEKQEVAIDFFESVSILGLTYRAEGNTVKNSFDTMKESFGL